MLLNNVTSKFWDKTYLKADELLDEVEVIDEAFQSVYVKSLAFSKLMLPDEIYTKVENEYILGVVDFNGDVNSVNDLQDKLWGGYHPTVLLFAGLRWYGEKGIYHYSDADEVKDSEALMHEINLAKTFVQMLPSNWVPELTRKDQDEKNVFQAVLSAAKARYALDTGSPLLFEDVVTLSGMSKRAVQNDVAKDGDKNLKYDGEKIEHKDAFEWLNERRNFVPTRSYVERKGPTPIYAESSNVNTGEKEYVFVPVTDDGAAFLPELRREAGYQIGKYGEEEYYLDYFHALKLLQDMDSPRFRRPNDSGNWGIKNVVSWKRVLLSELEDKVAQLS